MAGYNTGVFYHRLSTTSSSTFSNIYSPFLCVFPILFPPLRFAPAHAIITVVF